MRILGLNILTDKQLEKLQTQAREAEKTKLTAVLETLRATFTNFRKESQVVGLVLDKVCELVKKL
jgi:hypothetical protein